MSADLTHQEQEVLTHHCSESLQDRGGFPFPANKYCSSCVRGSTVMSLAIQKHVQLNAPLGRHVQGEGLALWVLTEVPGAMQGG